MAAGRPVIAYRSGGALETIKEYETGVFFNEQTVESLLKAVEKFDDKSFDPQLIRNHALQFDKEIFKKKFAQLL